MRSYDAATAAYIANGRRGIIAASLLWIVAKNRSTGLPETAGFWSGEYTRDFTINSVVRNYYSAGALIGIDDIKAQTGLVVRIHELRLSHLTQEVADTFRGYDARLAPVQIHRALFDLDTRELIAEPHRIFKGYVNDVDLPRAAIGGETEMAVEIASSARALTRGLSLKKSDESQRLRADDRFRRYADITGAVGVYWGERGS